MTKMKRQKQHVCRSTYPPPEDRESLSTGLTHQAGAVGVCGRVCRVSGSGRETKRPCTCPKTWLLPSNGPSTHHLIQQTTAWCPHGRGPRLHTKHLTKFTIIQNILLYTEQNFVASARQFQYTNKQYIDKQLTSYCQVGHL